MLFCVLWARTKLDGATAVVVPLHRKAADAFASFAALPIVTRVIAIMTVAHVPPFTRQRPFLADLLPALAVPRWRGIPGGVLPPE